MRPSGIVLVVAALAPAFAQAEIQQFPYEAVVQADDVYARSGPGQRYYPTSLLKSGERLTVHRHDPGGWYMISPPQGSFSWIDASLVQRVDETRGIVAVPRLAEGQVARAIVRIGSLLSDDHAFYGRELSNGDDVAILGEQVLPTDRGDVRMYKIAPPAREYRWAKGDFIVPVDATLRQQRDQDPFTIPSGVTSTKGAIPDDEPAPLPRPSVQFPTLPTSAATADSQQARELALSSPIAAPPADTASLRAQLREIDARYSDMVAQEPSTWALDDLEREYRGLAASAPAGIVATIDQRLAAVDRKRLIYEDYQDFLRLTSATDERDAELTARQASLTPAGGIVPTPVPGETIPGEPVPGTIVPGEPVPAGLAPGELVPQPAGNDPFAPTMTAPLLPGSESADPYPGFPGPMTGTPQTVGTPQVVGPLAETFTPPAIESPLDPSPADGPVAPQFNGAGLVQRHARPLPGMPAHVLVSPDGRLLAYLEAAEGVNLDAHVGQSLGLYGARTFDPRLQADRLIVRRLVPVRLRAR